jgi:hypothetical protein
VSATYCQYFDEQGDGPVTLEVVVDNFEGLPTRIFGFGFGFKLAEGDFNMNGAPIGGGITFYREDAVRVHAALTAWLQANPDGGAK